MAPLESYERDIKHPTRARTCAEFSTHSDDYMECMLEHLTVVMHPAGTCRMGSDEMAVIDSQLRLVSYQLPSRLVVPETRS